jgi:hypothetical protein
MNLDEKRLHRDPASEALSDLTSPDEVTQLPPHLIDLPGSELRVWRWAGLRGTGFPVSHVLQLSAPDCSSAADELLKAEDELEHKKEQALLDVREALDALRRDDNWKDVEKRKPLVAALRSLMKGKLPSTAMVADEIKPGVEAAHGALDKRDAAATIFQHALADASIRLSRALQEIAGTKRFQEAVIWQNRQAFHSAIIPLLQETPESGVGNSKQRQHKELIANYLQRYCVKNDTIGFFGPVGWARLVSQGEALNVRPGPGLLATRNVYFESWCIDALAETLNKNRALRPWIAPRPVPYIHLEGTVLCLPLARPVQLSQQQALALQLCDGERKAKQIAGLLMRAFPSEMKSEAATYNLLEQFSAKGLILWKLELPTGLSPERPLRRLLEGIENQSLRNLALEPLDELERGRAAVVSAADDPEKLDQALADLETSFTQLTDAASTRSAGKMYAARTLVYEDCRRDTEVEFGPQLLEKLGPPLSLLVMSARWYTFQVAEFYRRMFREIYRDLTRVNQSTFVDGATFWYRAQPLIYDREKTGATAILPDFQERWAKILCVPPGQRRLNYSFEQLRSRVQEAFAAPRAGWTSARHHSPDIMIAASSAEAVRRGEYFFVLGEFHLGVNTLRGAVFVAQHPRPEDIFRAVELDLPEHAVRITPPKSWTGITSRTTPILLPSENFRLMVTHDSISDTGAQTLSIGSLVIEERDGELFVRSRDGSLCFDIIETFADVLSNQMVNKLKLTKAGGHLPRITLDNLVLSRESWAFPAEELSFAFIKDDAERFLAIRRWAAAQEMPRFVFTKSPVEVKPFYVDFESPIYTDIFAKIVRRTKNRPTTEPLITISEMLPDHNQTWLSDAEGQRYTSEFRMVVVDSID